MLLGGMAVVALSIQAARRLAAERGRSPDAWMWAALFLGPLPVLILALLPPGRGTGGNSRRT
jgi:hypothetical protein